MGTANHTNLYITLIYLWEGGILHTVHSINTILCQCSIYIHTHLLKVLSALGSYWKHVRTQENKPYLYVKFSLLCTSLCMSSLNIYVLMHRALRIINCKTEDKWHLCDWILICSVIQSHEQNYACNSLIWKLASIIKQKFAYKRCCFLNTYDRKK